MAYEEVRKVIYTGEVWSSGQIFPPLADLITLKDHLIILKNGDPPFPAVLGVPHQAARGDRYICEHRLDSQGQLNPRRADENVAPIALVAFEILRQQEIPCKLVIMAHATTHDPNKILDSPYCREVFAEETSLLFEIHGSNHQRRLALELSAGRNHLANRMLFGRRLASALMYRYPLGIQKEEGKRGALILRKGGMEEDGILELPARNTHSLGEAARRNIQALHLEAKPIFRKSGDMRNLFTPDGVILGRAIALTIQQYFDDDQPTQ